MTTSPARFSLDISLREASNGIYAACKALVARRGGEIVLSDQYKSYISLAAEWLVDPLSKAGIMFRGRPGNGKTTLMDAVIKLVDFAFDATTTSHERPRIRIERWEARDIAELLMSEEGKKEYRRIKSLHLLAIDDIGDEPAEVINFGMVYKPVYDLLLYRYQRQLPTLLTTNLTSPQIEKHYGSRLRDRLREMMKVIDFTLPTFRK